MEAQVRGSGIGAHALKATFCSEATLLQYKLAPFVFDI